MSEAATPPEVPLPPKEEPVAAPAESAPSAPPQPAVTAASPKQPEKSGGWGWGGGWLSSVASYVQPTLSTVVSTSASIVIEPDSDEDAPKAPPAAAAPDAASATSAGPPPQPHLGEQSPAQKILEPLTTSGAAPEPAASSDGWDDGDDVLDGLIGAGTQLVSQGTTMVRDAWQTTGVKDSEIVKSATEAGQTVGSTAVDLLDAVGRHSLRFLTAQVGDPAKPRLVPIVSLPTAAVPVSTSASADAPTSVPMPTFEAIFEEASGPRSLQALERLSTESLRKIQQQQRKLSTAKLLAFNANVEKIQTVLFSDEEKPQLPAALAAQLSTTREQVADLLKEAKSSADPISVIRKESVLVLGKRAASGVMAVQTLIEIINKQSEQEKPTVDSLTARAAEVQALGAAHSALATRTAELFSDAVRSLTTQAPAPAAPASPQALHSTNATEIQAPPAAATPLPPPTAVQAPSPVANHIYVDGASAAASVADAVRFVLPVFQALLVALAAE